MKQGWEIKTLGDLYNITSSKRVFQDEWKSNGVPFYRAREIVKLAQNGFVDNELFISNEMYNDYSKKYGIPKEGDIMVTGVGTLGICYLVKSEDKFYFKDGNIIWLKTKGNVNSRYVEYAFKSDYLRKQIDDSVGATVGTYTIIKAKSTKIPFPPLPEQQCIVAILDEAFAAIAMAKANAEQNLKNAKELFESYLQGVFENKGEGWEEKTLGEIADIIGGYSFKSTDFKEEGKYQVIRMGNVRPGIIRENESPVFIHKIDENVLKRALLLPNDVIITQTGTKNKRDYGFTVIIEQENYLLNQRISAIRFPKNYLPKFFLYFSWTNLFKDQYFENERGTVGQGNVGIGAITNAIVPFLSLKDQHTIVQKLDALSAETKKLEAIYQKKIEDLEELKKSVLQKAFAGELKTEKIDT